jgi:CheY-like chemotaxis protein
LLNLVANAVKFTSEGEISLVGGYEQENIFFSIRDTGIGIDSEYLPHLFDPFYQVDSRLTRQFQGTGLGLAITKHLVTLMGGTIRVESEPNAGSVFEFRLPAPAVAAPTEIRKPDESMVGNLRVLVADDDEVGRLVGGQYLRKLGCTVDLAEDGPAVLRCMQSQKYDAIFLDMQMPHLDGPDTAREIRKLYGDTPFLIALTANAFPAHAKLCFDAGMNDFMTKPIDQGELRRVLSAVMASRLTERYAKFTIDK